MFKSIFIYWREILVSLPICLIKSWKAFGWRGAWLAFSDLVLTRIIIPVSLPGFGVLTKRNEARSLLDNFCLGELRCEEVEAAIREHTAPIIVDLGVNLGMSVRWWFHLNSKARVTCVEMMKESLDYTKERLKETHPKVTWFPVCAAVAAADAEPMEIAFNDPLEGTTSAIHVQGKNHRSVPVCCLDNIVTEPEVLLIKCDIEGSGGYALQGARRVLQRTQYLVTETHGADEMTQMSRILFEEGFAPFQLASRSLWWRRL